MLVEILQDRDVNPEEGRKRQRIHDFESVKRERTQSRSEREDMYKHGRIYTHSDEKMKKLVPIFFYFFLNETKLSHESGREA